MKLLTVNIEGKKHLKAIEALIRKESPQVVCFQEIFKSDVERFCKVLSEFQPVTECFMANANVEEENQYGIAPDGPWGVAMIGTKSYFNQASTSFTELVYSGSHEVVPKFSSPYSPRRSLIAGRIEVNGTSLVVATTHFTWSPNGKSSAQQIRDANQLRTTLKQFSSFIVAGDFNAPRGGEVYKLLSQGLTNHLSTDVISTIDSKLHYAGVLNIVVDHVFSTPDIFSVKSWVVDGVSDHKAVVVEFSL